MFLLTRDPIQVPAILDAMADPACGGFVFFLGTVRNHSEDRPVQRLHYEAYEQMAVAEMAKIGELARREFTISRTAIVHRLGTLEIGDIAVATAVAAAHRSEAFRACRFLIDRVKQDVPIWKKEFFADSAVWV